NVPLRIKKLKMKALFLFPLSQGCEEGVSTFVSCACRGDAHSFYTEKENCGIMNAQSYSFAFLPRKRSERLGKTDSAANNVSGGVCEAYVAAM
uniref:hypothetical protein n=1 Tax=Emergencia timonensis TaxID=1776384 RepID=UPI0024A9E966